MPPAFCVPMFTGIRSWLVPRLTAPDASARERFIFTPIPDFLLCSSWGGAGGAAGALGVATGGSGVGAGTGGVG